MSAGLPLVFRVGPLVVVAFAVVVVSVAGVVPAAAQDDAPLTVVSLVCEGAGATYYEVDCVDLLTPGQWQGSVQDVRLQRNFDGDQRFVLDLGAEFAVSSVEVQNSYAPWCTSTATSYANSYSVKATNDDSETGFGGAVTTACSAESEGWRFADLGGQVGRYIVISHTAITWSMVSGFRVIGSTPGDGSGGGDGTDPELVAIQQELLDHARVLRECAIVVVMLAAAAFVRSFGPGSRQWAL